MVAKVELKVQGFFCVFWRNVRAAWAARRVSPVMECSWQCLKQLKAPGMQKKCVYEVSLRQAGSKLNIVAVAWILPEMPKVLSYPAPLRVRVRVRSFLSGQAFEPLLARRRFKDCLLP